MKKSYIILICIAILALLIFVPLFSLKDAEFGGSDDKGSQVVETVDSNFKPIASPLIEKILGRELPGEVESLLFCIQTGIGVGVIAFYMGVLVERKRLGHSE